MNRLTPKILLAALAVGGLSFTAQAAAQTCTDITFTPEVYARWPDANDRCLEIVTRDNGRTYARFEAEVVRQSPSGTYVRYTLREGGRTESVKADAPEGMMAMIEGKATEIEDLVDGQKVNIYLPESMWAQPAAAAAPVAPAAEPEPAPAPAPEPVAEPEPEPEPAPAMPTTAGNLGWLAIFGAALLLLGGALRFSRQR